MSCNFRCFPAGENCCYLTVSGHRCQCAQRLSKTLHRDDAKIACVAARLCRVIPSGNQEDVRAEPEGALVVAVAPDAPAAGKLQPTEVIVGVDGTLVRTPADLRRLIAKHKPGERVELRVRAGGATRTVELGTIESPDEPGRPIVGIQVEQSASIELPLKVEIELGGVGGPSAGLAFALDVMEELRGNVDRGLRVAATGELELDGGVSPVGGIKQKVIGARRSGADVFLVPAGDNAKEARRYAGDLRVIAVESFGQALRALATASR